jgi:hypothetical protein
LLGASFHTHDLPHDAMSQTRRAAERAASGY